MNTSVCIEIITKNRKIIRKIIQFNDNEVSFTFLVKMEAKRFANMSIMVVNYSNKMN